MLTWYYCLEEPVAAAPLFCDYKACDYNSNTSSNMSHSSSQGYIFPRKHGGFSSEKVSQNVGHVEEYLYVGVGQGL